MKTGGVLTRWGFLVLGTLAATAVIVSSAAAHTQRAGLPGIDVSTRAGVVAYLKSLRIDTKGIVIQRNKLNYAGPNCPGVGWTCTTAKRVVQLTYAGNDSRFECTPSSGGSATSPGACTIIQVSSGGTNNARCSEATNEASASQSCVIFQTNTTGDNFLDIQQRVDANGGAAQDATQYAGIVQQNGSGSNQAQIHQDLKQSTKDTGPGGAQTQNGHQGVSVTQHTDTGDNIAHVDQSLAQDAKATGPTVAQNQNTGGSDPNTNAGITQTSNTGRNDAQLNQSNDLDAMASKASSGSQTQGSPSGGLNGFFSQDSAGVSTIHGTQREHQDLKIDGKPAPGAVTQTQYGPAHYDPDQGSNPNDRYDLSQSSEQRASNPTLQDDKLFTICHTTGICTADQRIQQQGTNQKNSCSASSCDFGLIVTNGDTATCGGEIGEDEGGCDTGTPSPPPPPFRGCEFDCLTIGLPNNQG
jgi:hypothetical protein